MQHQSAIDALVNRATSALLPLSVTVLGDDRVAIVEGYGGEAERVVLRSPSSDSIYELRDGGVRRVLGSIDGNLLAETFTTMPSPALLELPSLTRVANLLVEEVPCIVGSRVCAVSHEGIRFLSPWSSGERIRVDGERRAGLHFVQAMGSNGLAWSTRGPDGFRLRTVSWDGRDPTIATIAIDNRPEDMAVSPAGQRVALVVGGQVFLVDNGRCVEVPGPNAVPGICWLDEERLCWVTRHWPDSVLVTHSFANDSQQREVFVGWTLGRLHRSGSVAAAVATRHRSPPTVIETAQLAQPDTSCPEFGLIETTDGPLRTVTFVSGRASHGLVILLRGGPYGEWLPAWDPIVETIETCGWRAVQLESPYTAAILGRVAAFRRGQFGSRDAALVAEAAQALLRRFGLDDARNELAFIGHSYGAYLASRAITHLSTSAAGLVTMNGPWTTADLLDMGTDPASKNGPLSRFLNQAFATDSKPPNPHEELQDLPNSWGVIYGTDDVTAATIVTERAIERDKPADVLRLSGEPHIAKRKESIGKTIRFLDKWLRGVGAS